MNVRMAWLLLPLALLVGCDDDALCFDSGQPEFSTNALPVPVLNEAYIASLLVGVAGSPNDDAYGYTLTQRGSLPPGLSVLNLGRDIDIIGTPTAPGTYNFSLTMTVSDPLASLEELCYDSVTRNFRLAVAAPGA